MQCERCGKPARLAASTCVDCFNAERTTEQTSTPAIRRPRNRVPSLGDSASDGQVGEGMVLCGSLLVLAGVGIWAYALIYDTTTAGGSFNDYSRIHNLGLLSNRVAYVIMGGFTALSGVVLLAAAELRSAVLSPVRVAALRPPD